MRYSIPRRRFLSYGAAFALLGQSSIGAGNEPVSSRDRQLGLLLGGLIGDALGGPIEFSEASSHDQGLVGARNWDEGRTITDGDLTRLAASVPFHDYKSLRPDTSPYGPWRKNAIAGTLTDDSRHKIVLIHAIARANQQGRVVTDQDIAHALIDFRPITNAEDRTEIATLDEEGFREYRYAARWLLGERDLEVARPVERLWAGIANCSGQMMLPPLAAVFAGDPSGRLSAGLRNRLYRCAAGTRYRCLDGCGFGGRTGSSVR